MCRLVRASSRRFALILADERVGQEGEAVLRRVVEPEGGAHVLEVKRIGQRLVPALVCIEDAPESDG
jgi:hypothetical protein